MMLRQQAGLTLVEVTIGMALLSTALLVANMTYVSISKLQQKGISTRQVQQNGRYAMEIISRDIRNSDIAVMPAGNPGTALYLTNSLNGAQQVRYTYDQTSQTIQREICNPTCSGQRTSISSEGVRIPNVRYDLQQGTGRFVQISMRVEQKTQGLAATDTYYQAFDLNTSVALRGL